MRKLLLIVNPLSGKEVMKNKLLKVVQILSGAGFTVTVYPTKARADATEYVKNIKTTDYERIVVCGGDGTLNEVITGLMISGEKIPIGYIPCGTLNEWSGGLHIEKNVYAAAKTAAGDYSTDLDIGKFGDKYFTYTASFGAFTEASYSTPQDIKNVLGQAAYFFEGIKSIGNIKATHLKIETDEKTVEGDYLFGAVSNSMSVGGIVKFEESVVKLNDGFFEVLLISKPKNIVNLQPVIDGIFKHDLNREGMEFFHTKKLKVTFCDGLAWTLDGEYATSENELIIENLPSAIKFIVPKI